MYSCEANLISTAPRFEILISLRFMLWVWDVMLCTGVCTHNYFGGLGASPFRVE
jgi:hypothetical protein